MTISSYTTRIAVVALSLFPLIASSASARTVSLSSVVESAYTSTSPIVSRAWMDVFASDEDVLEEVVEDESPVPAKTLKVDYVDITAYRAVVEECDGDPLVTADGTYIPAVLDSVNIVAANHMPFGTKFRIPDHFGDKVFEVRDRMNARYAKRIDILMTDSKEVKQWGIKRKAKVEIVEMGTNAHKWNDPEMKEARKQQYAKATR